MPPPQSPIQPPRSAFDPLKPWSLSPRVSVRPESFGALLYDFGTRQLSFLKDRRLAGIVANLDAFPDARSACLAHQVAVGELAQFTAALARLAASSMLVPRNTEDAL